MKLKYLFTIKMSISLKRKHWKIPGLDKRTPALVLTQHMHVVEWNSHVVPEINSTVSLGHHESFLGVRVKGRVTDIEWELEDQIMKPVRVMVLCRKTLDPECSAQSDDRLLATIFPEITYREAMKNLEELLNEKWIPLCKAKGVEISTVGRSGNPIWWKQEKLTDSLLDS